MRIILLILCLLIPQLPIMAEDADFWDKPMQVDAEAKNQKPITDAEFEKVMSQLEKKKKKKQEKNKFKGAPSTPGIENLNDMKVLNNLYDTYPTIMIPLNLISQDNQLIEAGFYRVMSVKKPNEFYLNFYQGNTLVARVRAFETQNDHNQKTLNYIQLIKPDIENANYMQVIYGDLDCNLETYLNIKN